MPAYSHLMKVRDFGTPQQVFAKATYEAGGPQRLAHMLGKSRQMINLKSNPDAPDRVLWSDVATAVDAGAREPVHQLCARAGGVFLPLEVTPETLRDIAIRSPLECAEFLSDLTKVVSLSRHMTAAEGAALKKEILDAMKLLSAAYRRVDADMAASEAA